MDSSLTILSHLRYFNKPCKSLVVVDSNVGFLKTRPFRLDQPSGRKHFMRSLDSEGVFESVDARLNSQFRFDMVLTLMESFRQLVSMTLLLLLKLAFRFETEEFGLVKAD